MKQVTDEIVSVAVAEARRYARDVMGVACEIDGQTMRAALEAALAVLETNNDDLTDDQIAYCHERADSRRVEWRNDLVARLRRQKPAIGIVDSGVPNTLMDQAADLIERQAEEIAELQSAIANRKESVLYAKVDEIAAIVERLTAERADLIEALKIFDYRALLERLGAVIRD